MLLETVRDRAELEAHLRNDLMLRLYEVGDLDDFFWPHTTWYALRRAGKIEALALLYQGAALPTLLALCAQPEPAHEQLLRSVAPLLPGRVYTHLSGGLEAALAERFRAESHGRHIKMALVDPSRLDAFEAADVAPLGRDALGALERLYAQAYPDNWFVPRMLETGQYVGIRRGAELVCVAGVHVYSPRYRVAALGNVTTLPAWRGQGLAARACAALCRRLLGTVDHIGLNVHADNRSAIACYEKLGFVEVAEYEEWMLERSAEPCDADADAFED